MVKQLLLRGALAGALAGVVAFVIARIFTEPVIQSAIDYESARDAVQDKLDAAAHMPTMAAGADIFSRHTQSTFGLATGLIGFGIAMGLLVAVGYAVALGRTGRVRPFQLGLLVPAFYFVGIYLVPFLKYPANPPAIGHEDTIVPRTQLYGLTVAVSCLGLFLAVYLGQKLYKRYSLYASVLIAAAGYAAVMTVLYVILPPLGHLHANMVDFAEPYKIFGVQSTETPLPLTNAAGQIVLPGFPADVLARFRVLSIVNQVILWGGIALLFAPLAQRVVAPYATKAAKETRAVEVPESALV